MGFYCGGASLCCFVYYGTGEHGDDGSGEAFNDDDDDGDLVHTGADG